MDELVRSKKLQFEKSNLFIQIYKQENGYEYIKIIQNIGNDTKSSILINPNNLDEIIDTLINLKEEIALNQKIEDKYFIKEEDKQTIISTFLKGITIKDLSLQFRYKDEAIRELLVKNDIEIIEGIKIIPNTWKFRRKYK
ncbi:hypothetical protein K5L04_07150 [Flavobacterium psychrophilum]|uniref:hypothetical protein n=1 Tax=Flavobacterium psychrophilum TaxID=96345 RepID=UPI001C8F3683|nr:hypothetical protein [Flavobacterium psychrophilum]MCB6099623.1 hypothetical protein [Flavobacterium psychrophilum]QZK99504.1 hypothetical protein K5L04_07150 [Flavobacterium psychrophilum]